MPTSARPPSRKSPAKSYDPITATVRVFLDDAREWRWELSVWIGDVDTRNELPSMRTQSAKGYKSRGVAYKSGLAAAGKVV